MELGETEGRSEREIAGLTGISSGAVHGILSRANGWDKIAEEETFKRHRQEQNKALEQANRTLAAKALNAAEGKINDASFYQLVYGAAIMTDKARLLAGEPTQITASLSLELVIGADRLAAMLSQSLVEDSKTIDITPTRRTEKQTKQD